MNRSEPSCGSEKSLDAGSRNAQTSNITKSGAAGFVVVLTNLGQPPQQNQQRDSIPSSTHFPPLESDQAVERDRDSD
jgi:hypothetical protein